MQPVKHTDVISFCVHVNKCCRCVTCGNRHTLGDHAVIVVATGAHAAEGAVHVDTLSFSTHIAQQLTLVHVCGDTTEERVSDSDCLLPACQLLQVHSRRDLRQPVITAS